MKRTVLTVVLLAIAFSIFIVGRYLEANDFNPTTTIKFGEVFVEQNQYAEELLGDIVIAPMAGHDGKFFFSQAMDPFYIEPNVHAVYLDRPTYRAQRMIYPTVASLGGTLSAQATAWGLIVVNVVAMAVGTAYTALTAIRLGLSPVFGLAFFLNPGLIVDLSIDGAGVVAMAAMMAGVFYGIADSMWASAVSMTIASLARETMLIAAVGLAAFLWYRRRHIPWRMTLPVVGVASWWLFLRFRLDDGVGQDTQALDLPLRGFVEAFQVWLSAADATVDLLVGCLLLAVSLMVLLRSIRTPTALGWSVAGFAALGVFMSEPVWENWFDSSRALAPVVTAYVLMIPALTNAGSARKDEASGLVDSVRRT